MALISFQELVSKLQTIILKSADICGILCESKKNMKGTTLFKINKPGTNFLYFLL